MKNKMEKPNNIARKDLFRGKADEIERFNGNLNYITLDLIDGDSDSLRAARLAVYGSIDEGYKGRVVDIIKERPKDNGIYKQSISSSDLITTLEMPYFLVKAIHKEYAPREIKLSVDEED